MLAENLDRAWRAFGGWPARSGAQKQLGTPDLQAPGQVRPMMRVSIIGSARTAAAFGGRAKVRHIVRLRG